MSDWLDEMVEKIDNGLPLSRSQLREFEGHSIEQIEGESCRWTQFIVSIIYLGARRFAINWDRGLTEMQENEFYEQPYEVESKEVVCVKRVWTRLKEKRSDV